MELIKIEKKNGIETVNARELHEKLEVATKFADWVKNRIEKYGFMEGVDFIHVSEKKETSTGATLSREYYISIDMAKELAMVENNEQGRKIRQYFINVEKKAKELLLDKPKKQEQLDHKKMAELRRAFEKGLILADEYRTLLGFNYEKPEVLPSNIAKQVYAVAMSALEKKKTKEAIAIKSKDLWE